jgi:hypothetical protein
MRFEVSFFKPFECTVHLRFVTFCVTQNEAQIWFRRYNINPDYTEKSEIFIWISKVPDPDRLVRVRNRT